MVSRTLTFRGRVGAAKSYLNAGRSDESTTVGAPDRAATHYVSGLANREDVADELDPNMSNVETPLIAQLRTERDTPVDPDIAGAYTKYTSGCLCTMQARMGTKTVRLKEDVYERIKAKKRDDETFSEAIDRLTRDVSLLDWVDEDAEPTPERAERMKSVLDDAAEDDEAELDELAER